MTPKEEHKCDSETFKRTEAEQEPTYFVYLLQYAL